MSAITALAGGIFDTTTVETDDHTGELRELVDQLGRRSFDALVGCRGRPENFDAALWHQLEKTGLARLTNGPDADAGPAELAVVLYGLARHAAAVPIAETDVLAAWLGTRCGVSLPATGPMTVAIGTANASTGRITGTANRVPWASISAVLLIARADDRLYTGLIDENEIRQGQNLAGEPREAVHFTAATDRLHALDEATYAELQCRGAWARSMQMMGALDATAALTVTHTRERVQFGRPLSGFQSVQHALAAMAGQIERARAAATLAVAAAEDDGFDSARTDFAVTVCKTVIGRAAAEVTTIAHQLHGAIGVTAEHPLWLFTTRLRSWSDEFGTAAQHARSLGRAALAAASPWDLSIGNFTP